ncbi:MAG TPA: TRAP transporter TatT component family protein [Candidatus Acidoferrales bacterium]|nr:TRAP transporter TatT component family protein [Candidatus Acidoferrales bacterium]
MPGPWPLLLLLALAATIAGCSVKKLAVNKLGDSLASGGTTFTSDDDPDLVGEALPFSLKLMESLLAETPKHRGLLFAASSGFTQYAYVFVQQPAEQAEDRDLTESDALHARARRLYLRAKNYGLRGLETRYPGLEAQLRANPTLAVKKTTVADVPLLYWTAVSWGAAIAESKDNPEIVADQSIVEALIDRSFELDPDFDHGTIHNFLIAYESVRIGASKDSASRSRRHYERAVELTSGQSASPYVAFAEAVSISSQNREEFESLLKKALAVNPDTRPEWRLSNMVMQRRARWLLSREDELFVK